MRKEEKNDTEGEVSENIMPLCRSPVQPTLAPEGTYANLRRVSTRRWWVARGLCGTHSMIQRGGAASSV